MISSIITKINKFLAIFLFIGVFSLQPLVLASTYGSGSYNSCGYGKSCPASGTGSSTTTPGTDTTQPAAIVLNDFSEFTSDTGKTLTLSSGQTVYFDVASNGQTVRYSITVKQVGSDFIVLSIGSTTFSDVTIRIGESKQIDVNGDGQNDIEITLVSIANGVATITFRALAFGATTTTSKNTPAATASTAAASSHNWIWIVIFAVILLLGLVWFILLMRKKRKDRNTPGPY